MQRTRTPELVSVDSQPIWSKGVQSLPSASSLNQRFRDLITKIHDLTGDPRVGPFLLLGALMSFGSIWLRRSQSIPQPGPPNPPDLKVNYQLKIINLILHIQHPLQENMY